MVGLREVGGRGEGGVEGLFNDDETDLQGQSHKSQHIDCKTLLGYVQIYKDEDRKK